MPVDTRDMKQDLDAYGGSDPPMPALDLAALTSLTCSSADVVEAVNLEDYCDVLADEFGCTETQSSVSEELRRNIQEQQRTGVYNEVKIIDTKSDAQNHSVSVVCLKAQWSADGKQVFVAYVQHGVSWTPTSPSCLEGEEARQRVLRQLKVQALTDLVAKVQTSEPGMLTAAEPATRVALDVTADQPHGKDSACLPAGGSAGSGSANIMEVNTQDIRQDLAKYGGSEASMPALDLAALTSLTGSSADVVEAVNLEDYCDVLADEFGCTETQSSVSEELRRNIQEQQRTGVYNEVKIIDTKSDAQNHSVSVVCLKAQWSADEKQVFVAYVQQGVSWTPAAPSRLEGEETMHRVLGQLKVQALTDLLAKVQTSEPGMLTAAEPATEAAPDVMAEQPDGKDSACLPARGSAVSGSANMMAVDTQDVRQDHAKYGGSESRICRVL